MYLPGRRRRPEWTMCHRQRTAKSEIRRRSRLRRLQLREDWECRAVQPSAAFDATAAHAQNRRTWRRGSTKHPANRTIVIQYRVHIMIVAKWYLYDCLVIRTILLKFTETTSNQRQLNIEAFFHLQAHTGRRWEMMSPLPAGASQNRTVNISQIHVQIIRQKQKQR